MGLLLQRHLGDRLQLDVPFLHGGVTRTGRDAMVRRFQDGEGAPILLVSLKAGGTGLNLTAASQVIHYDRWWNPAVEDQATDRAWRLGQAHTVLVHKLVCEGTLEERISQLIDDKKQLANSVLGTGEQWLTELSTDALRSLVTLTPGTR
jgi:SNF2 family DNA or RNA helicase